MQVPGPSAPGESGAAAGSASGAHLTHPLPPGTSPLRPRLGRWSRDVAGGLSIRRAAPQACLGQSRHGAAVQKPGWVVAEPCRASRGAPACPPPPHTTAGLTRPGPEGQAAVGSPLCVQRGPGQRQGRGHGQPQRPARTPTGPPRACPLGSASLRLPPLPLSPRSSLDPVLPQTRVSRDVSACAHPQGSLPPSAALPATCQRGGTVGCSSSRRPGPLLPHAPPGLGDGPTCPLRLRQLS